MIECLRSSLLYSEKPARDVLFGVVRDTLRASLERDSGPITVAKLTRAAEQMGRDRGLAQGIGVRNWEMPARAVVNTMLRAQVLLGPGGKPIPSGVAATAAEVTGLTDDFEMRCEAFLTWFLICKLRDVSVRDHRALAHALLRRFDPSVPIADLEDQVVLLLSRLEQSVTMTEDGTYVPLDADVSPSVIQ